MACCVVSGPSPLPAADALKSVVSLRLAWELLAPSWWVEASAMKNCGASELRQWHEQLVAANTRVLG